MREADAFRAEGIGWRWQILLFAAAACAIFFRRPDALLNPQFYAEDGAVWYAQAYNLGWLHSLALPEGGYLNTLPRLVAGLCLLVPLKSAPLLMNWFGIAFQVLPVTLLMSSRCGHWAPLPVRCFQALAYVALPNSREINVVLTNAQWHLALAASLLVFATPPAGRLGRLFDTALLILCGLTGPFCLLLLPFAVFFWWRRRQPWSLTASGILAISAIVQLAELTFHPGRPARLVGNLGASPAMFSRILAGQVFTAVFAGANQQALHASTAKCVTIAVVGIFVVIYCCYSCPLELRLFVAFSMLLLGASLRSPLVAGPGTQWQILADDAGGRYWFFPMLAFFWSLIWIAARNRSKVVRAVFIIALLFTSRGIHRDWTYPPFADEHFGSYVQQFEAAAPGTTVVFPLFPDGIKMVIVKKH